MDEPKIRRRRRSNTEKLPSTNNKLIRQDEGKDLRLSVTNNDISQGSIESLSEDAKQNFNHNHSQAQIDISITVNKQSVNSIRTELLEDSYHSDFAESDYSNDTHDWGEHGFEHSDEYWHFLGRFE